LKELLMVSSDWKQANNLKQGGDCGSAPSGNAISSEFQNKQIDRIVEAIGLTLPGNGALNPALLGSSGNTLSTANLDIPGNMNQYHNSNSTKNNSKHNQQNFSHSSPRYEENNVRDLAYDLGVDHKLLKQQL
jgi:hypothetical protein